MGVIAWIAVGLNPTIPTIPTAPATPTARRFQTRIVTMPIQSQGIITRDNVSVDKNATVMFPASRRPHPPLTDPP